ncbi:MAG: efflux RND transporter periplasmic adaptor subunit [Actinomycetes bacterium]
MRKWLIVLAVVVVVLGVSAWLLLRKNDQATTQYKYAKVTRADVSRVVTGSGTVKPSSTLAQRAFRQGFVTSLGVAEGARVKPGRELFRSDGKPVFALAGSIPFYRMLTSASDKGKDVRALQEMLKSLGYYKKSVSGTYSVDTQAATADFLDARGLPATPIVGPETFQTVSRDAVVLSRPVSVGDVLQPGQVAMITTSRDSYKAVIDVNEIDIAQVEVGQKATMTLSALPGQSFTGMVTGVSPGLAPGSSAAAGLASSGGAGGTSTVVTFPVTIAFDKVTGAVKSGMSVDANIVLDTVINALTVPVSALQLDGATYFVEVPAADENNAPLRVNVEAGLRSETLAEITKGLSEGQTVIEGLDVNSIALPSGGLLSRPDQMRGKQGAGQ